MKKSHLLIGLLTLIWGAAQAQTTTEAPDHPPSKEIVMSPWGKPYPYSAHSVFERLKTIIETPPEKLNHLVVEKVFETKLNSRDPAIAYGLPVDQWGRTFIANSTAGQGGAFFTLTLVADMRSTKETHDFSFSFQWWDTMNSPSPYYNPMCISVELFKPVFTKMGFEGKLFSPRHGFDKVSRTFSFVKSPYETATINYQNNTNCITSFQFGQQH